MASKTTDSNRPKPRKSLSAYKLFCRYKRSKIAEAGRGSERNSASDKKAVCHLLGMAAGVEHFPSSVLRSIIPPDRLDEFRRTNIRLALLGQDLFSKGGTRDRPPRKKLSARGFKISVVEMNGLMMDSWNAADKFTKAVFQELADDGRNLYNHRKLIEHSIANHIFSDDKKNPMQQMTHKPAALGFVQFKEVSLFSKAKNQTIAPVELHDLDSSELDLAFELLPFRKETSLSRDVSQGDLSAAVSSMPHVMRLDSFKPFSSTQKRSHQATRSHVEFASQGAPSAYPTQPTMPRSRVIAISSSDRSKKPINNLNTGRSNDARNFFNGSKHSCHDDDDSHTIATSPLSFLALPFLAEAKGSSSDSRRESSSFGPRSSTWSTEPSETYLKSTIVDNSAIANFKGKTRCRHVNFSSPSFLSSFPPPPFMECSSSSDDSTDSSLPGYIQVCEPKRSVVVNSFRELITLLDKDHV